MTPVSPLKPKRVPESVRRRIEVAAASAWEALVEAHTSHALRFAALLAARMPFDESITRYLGEMDVRDPMASSIRSRVLIALEHARRADERRPTLDAYVEAADEDAKEGLRRFRPDVLMKGIARKYRETEEAEQWISLSIARAEEGVINAHIDNAVVFAGILEGHAPLEEAVEDYIELLKISGGRAQAVYQRTMARLADLHLPREEGRAGAGGHPADSGTPGRGPGIEDAPTSR